MDKLSDEEFNKRAKVLELIDRHMLAAAEIENIYKEYFGTTGRAWFDSIIDEFDAWHDAMLEHWM